MQDSSTQTAIRQTPDTITWTIPKPSKPDRIKGIFYDKSRGKWVAQITIGGKKFNLGRYFQKEDAAKQYNQAREKYKDGRK